MAHTLPMRFAVHRRTLPCRLQTVNWITAFGFRPRTVYATTMAEHITDSHGRPLTANGMRLTIKVIDMTARA